MSVLHTADPLEDAGALTAQRYMFQYCCAAARLLAALATGTRCELICEWHEDYLVVTPDGLEAVSVKHREDHLPAWSIATLCSKGQLEHLFNTFRGGEVSSCCLETNRAHTAGDLWSAERTSRDRARNELAERLGKSRAEIDPFVDALQISSPPVPDRQYIEAAYAAQFAAPALDRLGIVHVSPQEAMTTAYQIVGRASVNRV